MKIISFSIKKKVVQKILVHLKLWDEPSRQWAPPLEKSDGNDFPLKSSIFSMSRLMTAGASLQSFTWHGCEEE